MKKYKVWEILKMAAEFDYKNTVPKERPHFKDKNGRQWTFIKCAIGVGLGRDDSLKTITIEDVNAEYELVQQSISFIEAVKAYAEGNDVECENGDFVKEIYTYGCYSKRMLNENDRAPSVSDILQGKWYVREVTK